jgi:hypothetical protein
MESKTKPTAINILPLINKALSIFQWKHDFNEANSLCQKALITRTAELARTEGEVINAISYAEATRTQLEIQEKYPQLAAHLQTMSASFGGPPGF